MQDAVSAAYPLPRRAAPSALARPEANFFHLLRSTAGVFAHHPLPVMACALICFASAGIIGSLVYGAIIGEAVLRTGSHTGTTMRAYNTQMFVQALIGACAFTVGRGALTWIALQERVHGSSHPPITFGRAMRAALREWRPLVLSTLLYGGVITLGLLGLTILLRELRLDVSNTRSIRIGDFNNILNWTMIRAISLLPPDPGSPFTDWIAATRYNLARGVTGTFYGFEFPTASRSASPQALITGLASIALLICVDALLCLRTAAIFAGGAGQSAGWLQRAVRVSSAHLGRVLLWRWSLRLGMIAFAVATLVLLPALHQVFVVGPARQALGTGYWPYHVAQSAYGVGIAFASGILFAVSVVFESRMYHALAPRNTA